MVYDQPTFRSSKIAAAGRQNVFKPFATCICRGSAWSDGLISGGKFGVLHEPEYESLSIDHFSLLDAGTSSFALTGDHFQQTQRLASANGCHPNGVNECPLLIDKSGHPKGRNVSDASASRYVRFFVVS